MTFNIHVHHIYVQFFLLRLRLDVNKMVIIDALNQERRWNSDVIMEHI